MSTSGGCSYCQGRNSEFCRAVGLFPGLLAVAYWPMWLKALAVNTAGRLGTYASLIGFWLKRASKGMSSHSMDLGLRKTFSSSLSIQIPQNARGWKDNKQLCVEYNTVLQYIRHIHYIIIYYHLIYYLVNNHSNASKFNSVKDSIIFSQMWE